MTERILGGTDGFRGRATKEEGPGLINAETFAGLTSALVARQLELGLNGPVVIGQDTRPSGDGLRRAAIDGALMHGVEVWDVGVAPTPMVQKVAQELGAIAAVAVTASHNPARDNGWKGLLGSEKPSKAAVADISNRYWRAIDSGLVIPSGNTEKAIANGPELTEWYAGQVVASIEGEFGSQPLEGKLIVVDGAYGAAQNLTPDVLRWLGASVEEFCCDGSGTINDGCGAANLQGLRAFLESRPDITAHPGFMGALANDGDSDRMLALGVVTRNDGGLEIVEVSGNHIMGVHADGEPGIVGTEYTNGGLRRSLAARGIEFEECENGDMFVTQRLRAIQAEGRAWRRGGEFTGHNVDLDWLSSGDGVRMAAWLSSYAAANGATFGSISQDLPLWPETMKKVMFPDGQDRAAVLGTAAVQTALLQAGGELGDQGRLIVRASGTESAVRIWGEGSERAQIDTVVGRLEKVVRAQAAA